jgi:Xaa-Pro aminopeptidase
VVGNAEPLQPGHAFSVEPGIYPGRDGARIEDRRLHGHRLRAVTNVTRGQRLYRRAPLPRESRDDAPRRFG